MAKKFGFKKNYEYVAVPAAFVDNYAGEANPSYVVVYLCALRAAEKGGIFDFGYFADKLGIKESVVKKAFEYWEKNDIIKICDDEIEFLPIENVVGNTESENDSIDEEENKAAKNKTLKKESEFFPNYTNEDFDEFCKNGNECRTLIGMAEKQLYGKQINFNERKFILALHYSFGFSLDVLAVLFNYCSINGKTGRRYIETIAYDWYDKHIDTSEKAEKYLSRFDDINVIMRALGINEEPTKNESAKIEKWLNEYKLSMDIIKKGCEKTVENTMPNNKKGRFAYAEKIFSDWFKNGVRTLADVCKMEIEFEENKKNQSVESNRKKEIKISRVSDFAGYENQREFNPEEGSERQRKLMEELLSESGGSE